MFPTNLEGWPEAHVFYNSWSSHLTTKKDLKSRLEMSWKEFILNETPNGELFLENELFNQLQNGELFLIHLTPNMHNILKDNLIYPSGGCLVGSIYCVPVTKTEKGFRVHNLGSFIYHKEIPTITKTKPHILFIKTKLPEHSRNRLIGVDYLRLGEIHFDLYKELEYLLSSKERFALEKACVAKIQELIPLLILVQNKFMDNKRVDINQFFKLFYKHINNNAILSYILFEAFCEFTSLYQNSSKANSWKKKGEVYTWYFKEGVFELGNKAHFDLTSFQPKIDEIYKYLKNKKAIKSLNYKQVEQFFFEKITLLLFTRLWSGDMVVKDWRKIALNFNSLVEYFKPLIGHTIHRELRNFGRYPNFYYYFDQLKALTVWNYWNHSNIAIPFNGIIPKGEIGINPAFPDLNLEFFETDVHAENNDELYVSPKNKINVDFVPRLIDLKFTTLRSKNNEEGFENFQNNQ